MEKGTPTKGETYNLSRSKVIKDMAAEIPANADMTSAVFAIRANAEYRNRTGKSGKTMFSVAHSIRRAKGII